jgi:hypothetical protein
MLSSCLGRRCRQCAVSFWAVPGSLCVLLSRRKSADNRVERVPQGASLCCLVTVGKNKKTHSDGVDR